MFFEKLVSSIKYLGLENNLLSRTVAMPQQGPIKFRFTRWQITWFTRCFEKMRAQKNYLIQPLDQKWCFRFGSDLVKDFYREAWLVQFLIKHEMENFPCTLSFLKILLKWYWQNAKANNLFIHNGLKVSIFIQIIFKIRLRKYLHCT